MNMPRKEILNAIAIANTPFEPLGTMRLNGFEPVARGENVFLIDPRGRISMICSEWYAMTFCESHIGWEWETL